MMTDEGAGQSSMSERVGKATAEAVRELLDIANVPAGGLLVVGCSTSEIRGNRIGSDSGSEEAGAVFDAIYKETEARGLHLAVQCCEHLNRALIVEREAVSGDICNVVPQLHAGGALAVEAYRKFLHPVAVETLRADAGLDIGDTFIGMHMKAVVVPVRLKVKAVGRAHVTACRVRPRFIGGVRAAYDETLL